MSYPGNTSLADEIQQKILDTFRQTLDLAESGKREEALLGCDFVRRLDPQFEPVNTLSERLEAQAGAVPVDDLRLALAGADSGEAPPTPETRRSLRHLDRMLLFQPGIETAAPERTDRRSGFGPLPKDLPVAFSSFLSAVSTWPSIIA